jgi:hypothetical protein
MVARAARPSVCKDRGVSLSGRLSALLAPTVKSREKALPASVGAFLVCLAPRP